MNNNEDWFKWRREKIVELESTLDELNRKRAHVEDTLRDIKNSTSRVRLELSQHRASVKAREKLLAAPDRAEKDAARAARQAASVERYKQALKFKRAGAKLSEIAETFGVSSSRASDLVRHGERVERILKERKRKAADKAAGVRSLHE